MQFTLQYFGNFCFVRSDYVDASNTLVTICGKQRAITASNFVIDVIAIDVIDLIAVNVSIQYYFVSNPPMPHLLQAKGSHSVPYLNHTWLIALIAVNVSIFPYIVVFCRKKLHRYYFSERFYLSVPCSILHEEITSIILYVVTVRRACNSLLQWFGAAILESHVIA